jgi:predicted amidohydrolase YtcJ
MRDKFSSDMVRVSHLKINLDGGDEGWNGLYTFPYADKPEIVPEPIIPYDVLNDVVRRADAAGIDVTCHCFGDLAVQKLLDAIEAAIKVNPKRERHNAISHASIVHPDDRQRFAELGVPYDSSGGWFALDPVQLKVSAVRLGIDRVNQNYPIRQIADMGGNISLGSDWPAAGYSSEYRPLIAIQTAVTRQPIGAAASSPIMGGKEWRLTVEQALRASTLGAATGMGRNKQIGSLEVGKFADMVVLDQNLFEIDPYAISDVEVLKTIMNGKLVYESN